MFDTDCQIFTPNHRQDGSWEELEQSLPGLYEEAVAMVAVDSCTDHQRCLQAGTRYIQQTRLSKKRCR